MSSCYDGPCKQTVVAAYWGIYDEPQQNHAKSTRKDGAEELCSQSSSSSKKKIRVDKKQQERLKKEKEIQEGGEGWRRYMDAKGFQEVERHNPSLLYQVYGPAPNPNSTSSSDEE